MIIKTPVLSIDGDVARISADIVLPDETRTLWFECNREHADKISTETTDGFLVATLFIAMSKGLDIVVEGSLSSRLYYNISNYLIELIRNAIPGTKKVSINAQNLVRQNWGGTGVFTGFSAGVDSFCTFVEHTDTKCPAEYRVTHFLFNDVGAHEEGNDKRAEVFSEHLRRMQICSEEWKIPLISVNSNISDVIGGDFIHTSILRNLAVPLLFQKACSKFLYSSSVHFRDTRASAPNYIDDVDSMAIHLFSTETIECISAGGQHLRFEKTEIMAADPRSYRNLDVCIRHDISGKTNCSWCPKCMRTQLTLEMIGALDKYESVFDFSLYRRFRWLFFCLVMTSDETLLRELRRAITERKYPVPISVKWVARCVPNRIVNLVFYRSMEIKSVNPIKLFVHIVRMFVKKRVGASL
ncbi:MAG: hypothetical protein WC521_07920 [Bdellovibrionales bacterium]